MRALLLLSLLLAACAPATSPARTLPDTVAALPFAADTSHLRVVVMGDQGTGTDVQWKVAAAMQTVCARAGCDLGVALGDNFYPASPKEVTSPVFHDRFELPYGPLKIPFLVVPGNHDESWLAGGDGADSRGAEVEVAYGKLNPQWVMPARDYRAPVGQLVEFFAVDTSPLAAYLPPRQADERAGGAWEVAQRQWLTGVLARSSARWKLVLGHHPLFSNSVHGDAGHYDGLGLSFQRGDGVRQLYDLACGQANVLLSGHDHALEVFSPQPECPDTWTLVSGAAGNPSSPGGGTRPAAFEAYRQPGFMVLDLTPEALTVQVYVLDEAGAATLAHTQVIAPRP